MNWFHSSRHLTAILLALAVASPALAHDKRLTLTWINVDTGKVYEVKMPAEPPLHAMKKKFMAHIGLSAKRARHYVVEQVVLRAPPPVAVPYTRGPIGSPVVVAPLPPLEEYVLLDEKLSLLELGISEGATLRLRQVANDDARDHHRRHKERHAKRHKHHGDGDDD